jgi:signal peptidase II
MKLNLNKLYNKKPIYEHIIFLSVILVGILLDQLTKYLAVTYLEPVGSVPLIKGVLHLTYVENPGAAFGMLKDAPWLFNTVSILAVLGMGGFLFLGHSPSKLYSWAIALIVSGGVRNLIDRFSLKYVIDFIDFTLIDFAVFNGADSFVCIGAGLLILALILDLVKEAKMKKGSNSNDN